MSSSEAQRSPVHQSTEDSNLEPSGPSARPGNAGPEARGADPSKTRPDQDARGIEGGVGAADGNSGGGEGAGTPGGGTDMRTSGAFSGGNVDEDRNRLFPESQRDDASLNPNDPDESSFGGPLKLDDPDAPR